MEEYQHVEDSEGPARGFKIPNGPKCDQGDPESFPGKGVPGRSESSRVDGPHIQGTEAPTVSEYDQKLLRSLPIHIDLGGRDISMSNVPRMIGGTTLLSVAEKLGEGWDERHNTLNLLGTWTAEGEQVFIAGHRLPAMLTIHRPSPVLLTISYLY